RSAARREIVAPRSARRPRPDATDVLRERSRGIERVRARRARNEHEGNGDLETCARHDRSITRHDRSIICAALRRSPLVTRELQPDLPTGIRIKKVCVLE